MQKKPLQPPIDRLNSSHSVERVAVLGAAFDPIHYGHAACAVSVLVNGFADEVWLCPSPDRWDKSPIAPSGERLKWAGKTADILAQKGFSIKVTSDEIDAGAYRGTYLFLQRLKEKHPSVTFSFILGTDAFLGIEEWMDPTHNDKNGLKIIQEFELILAPRKSIVTLNDAQKKYPEGHFIVLPPLAESLKGFSTLFPLQELANLSSSEIRAKNIKEFFNFPEIVALVYQSGSYK